MRVEARQRGSQSCCGSSPRYQPLLAVPVPLWRTGWRKRYARPLLIARRRPIHTTSWTQRHHIPSADQSKHAMRSGTARTVAHRRKTTWRTDPHSMATWKERHIWCHRHRHRHRLIPSSNIGEGWWRCRERRHQEGGQVRWSSTNVHAHPTGVRNAWTH